MTSRIDRIARASPARRKAKAGRDAEPGQAAPVNLPVPVGEAREVPRAAPIGGEAILEAQLIGQDGQKRGLRGGQPVLDAARKTYSGIEWSGSWDRRARKGRRARTEV